MTFDPATETGFPSLDTPLVQANEQKPEAARLPSIPWYRLLIALWNRTGGQSGIIPGAVLPGTMQIWPGEVIPSGYLLCNGAAVLVADFPALFSAIGYKWGGAGDTFNLPNAIDRMPYGASGTYPLGTLGGAPQHVLTQANLPNVPLPVTDPGHNHTQNSHNHVQNSHNHAQDSHNHSQNSHAHGVNDPTHNHSQNPHSHIGNMSPGTANTSARPTNGSGGITGIQYNTLDTTATNNPSGTGVSIQGATATNNATTATNQATTAINQAATATNNANTTGISVSTGGANEPVPTLPPFFAVYWIIKY